MLSLPCTSLPTPSTRARKQPRSTGITQAGRRVWLLRWWTRLCGRPWPQWPSQASPLTACVPPRSICWGGAPAGPYRCASGPPPPLGCPPSPSSSPPSTGQWTSSWTPVYARSMVGAPSTSPRAVTDLTSVWQTHTEPTGTFRTTNPLSPNHKRQGNTARSCCFASLSPLHIQII